MHGLGIAGMPRRIPNYADGFIGLNSFMTIGTFATALSLLSFAAAAIARRATSRSAFALVIPPGHRACDPVQPFSP
jgi:heme/copper-type cytochrome/quinol oxidase subunit 1